MNTEPWRIIINSEWCKSCGICITFCPSGTLAMAAEGKARAVNEDTCTGCGLCERLCPDLAIVVTKQKVSV